VEKYTFLHLPHKDSDTGSPLISKANFRRGGEFI